MIESNNSPVLNLMVAVLMGITMLAPATQCPVSVSHRLDTDGADTDD